MRCRTGNEELKDPVLTTEGHVQLEQLLDKASSLRYLLAKQPVSATPPPPASSSSRQNHQQQEEKENAQPSNGKHGYYSAVSRTSNIPARSGTAECRLISIRQVSLRHTFSLITIINGVRVCGRGHGVTPSVPLETNMGSGPASVLQGRR